jgi:hypothetical protein
LTPLPTLAPPSVLVPLACSSGGRCSPGTRRCLS